MTMPPTRPPPASAPLARPSRRPRPRAGARQLAAATLAYVLPHRLRAADVRAVRLDAYHARSRRSRTRSQLYVHPDPVTLDGWQTAFNELDPSLPRLFLNSAIIAAAVTVTNVVLGSMAGYAFARLRFPGREILFLARAGDADDPRPAAPRAGLPDPERARACSRASAQYVGVVLVLAISATSIFLLRQYFLSIPRELEEAAKIDGAGFFTTFWRVMLPLAPRPSPRSRSSSSRAPGTGSSGPRDPPGPGHWTLPLGSRSSRTLRLLAMAAADGGRRHVDRPDPDPLPLLPALLRRGHRGRRRQGLTVAGTPPSVTGAPLPRAPRWVARCGPARPTSTSTRGAPCRSTSSWGAVLVLTSWSATPAVLGAAVSVLAAAAPPGRPVPSRRAGDPWPDVNLSDASTRCARRPAAVARRRRVRGRGARPRRRTS